MSLVYIVFARFEWLSFERKERYVIPTAEKMKAITEKLDTHIAKIFSQIKKEAEAAAQFSPVLKVTIFLSSAVFVVICVAMYLFLSIIRKVFFNLLIGWKGMALGSLNIMFNKFFQLMVQLTGAVHIPVSVVEVLLYPFSLICQVAAQFDVNSLYGLMVVTCQGAKAPIELFIDSFVLGVSILFIESQYNFLWSMSLREMNKAFLVNYWIEGKKILSVTFILSSVAFMLSTTNPFITMLRFLLSFVNFGAFFARDSLTHLLSPACVGIKGFQNQELWLVNATSVLVWWLLPPMLYMTSQIVCPKGGYTSARTAAIPFFENGRPSASASVLPLTTQQNAVTDDNFSIGSLIISESENDHEDHSQSTGSIYISEESPEVDSDHQAGDTVSRGTNVYGDSDDEDDDVGPGSTGSYNGAENNNDTVSVDMSSAVDVVVSSESDSSSFSEVDEFQSTRTGAQNADVSTIDPSSDLTVPTVFGGMLRYAWSHIWMSFSVDLMFVYILNFWVAHCQKLYDVEQLLKLRATRRWSLQTVQQSIPRFRTKRLQARSLGPYRNYFFNYETTSRAAQDSVDKKWYNLTHQLESNKLPPYFRLCFMVQHELLKKLQYFCCIPVISIPISYIVAFSGVGHLCTVVGRKHWGIAIWKYYLFLCVCVGFWTDETYEAYEIEELVKEFTILDADEATILFIPLTIASRVILLQVLGDMATLLSIVVINLCGSPLFVFSPKLQKILPPLIHWSPRKVAMKREKIELLGRRDVEGHLETVHMQEWVLALRSLSIFFTESRLLVFFANSVSLFLAVVLLKDIAMTTTNLSLCMVAMLPYFVGSVLIPIIYIGKRLNITDDDFQAVLSLLSSE